MDIKNAKITQLGRGRVELSMVLNKPVPEIPPFRWVAFGWQFEGGCVTDPQEPQKNNIAVHWHQDIGWWAQWGLITNCDPRQVAVGNPISDFRITGAKVRVRVELDDLMLAVPGEEILPWHAATRLLAFVHPVFPHTITVDIAPNRLVPNPSPPPPYTGVGGEDPAIFVPR